MHDKCLPLNLLPVLTQDQITTVAQLASMIWNEHFPAIIGQEQVNYMLEKFQSYQTIYEQISAGYRYHLLELNHHSIGYLAIKIDQVDAHMQLSKFYLLQQVRRQGVGTLPTEYDIHA